MLYRFKSLVVKKYQLSFYMPGPTFVFWFLRCKFDIGKFDDYL